MNAMREPISVAVLDNDAMAAEAMSLYAARLCPEATVAWHTGSVALALHRCLNVADPPDVLLLDMALDGITGAAVGARIRAGNGRTGIIAVTAWDPDEYRDAAVSAGLQALLPKDMLIGRLAETIRAVAAGEPWPADGPFDTVAGAHRRLAAAGGGTGTDSGSAPVFSALSERERDILLRYARGQSTDMIASALRISRNSVFTYVRRACAKLGVRTRDEALALVRRHQPFGRVQ